MTATIQHDGAQALEAHRLTSVLGDSESARWRAHARVDKYDADQVRQCRADLGLHREPTGPELLAWAPANDFVEADGNLLTRLGLARLGNLFIGATGAASQALNASHCRIGVGDTATAAATTDTDLGAASGSTHRQYKLVDSITQGTGASSGVTTIVATFATSQANFPWAEWGIDGGTGDGTTVTSETASTPGLCNHKITSLGTKTSSATWVFTCTITVS